MRTSFIFCAVFSTMAFGMNPWFPFRLEYSSNTTQEMGVSSGLWWTWHADEIPLDAYGPIVGIKALMHEGHLIPGLCAGLEANAWFLCGRMQCNAYLSEARDFSMLANPQIGLTWLSLVNIYVGYARRLAGISTPAKDGVTLSLCVNLPSYFFENAE